MLLERTDHGLHHISWARPSWPDGKAYVAVKNTTQLSDFVTIHEWLLTYPDGTTCPDKSMSLAEIEQHVAQHVLKAEE